MSLPLEITLLQGIQLAQFPILLLLVLFSFRMYRVSNQAQYGWICGAWILNLIYLAAELFSQNQSFLLFANILDVLSAAILLFGLVVSGKLFKGKRTLRRRASILVSLALLTQVVYYFVNDFHLSQWLSSLTNFLAFGLYTIFFYKELSAVRVKRYFLFGPIIYCVIQWIPVVLSEHDLDQWNILVILGFTLGLLSKVTILYGLVLIYTKLAFKPALEILGGIFHEISSPIYIMDAKIREVLENYQSELKSQPKLYSLFEDIKSNHQATYDITDATYELYKSGHLDTGQLIPPINTSEDEVFSINTPIYRSINSTKVIFGKDKVQFKFKPSEGCTVRGSSTEMMRAFNNLFKNTIEAINEGEAVILIKTSLEKDDRGKEKVKVIVEDNAGGIDPKILIKLEQGKYSTKSAFGRGYGLNFVKNAVSNIKGSYKISNISSSEYSSKPGMRFEMMLNKS